jgi:hypothetical protein
MLLKTPDVLAEEERHLENPQPVDSPEESPKLTNHIWYEICSLARFIHLKLRLKKCSIGYIQCCSIVSTLELLRFCLRCTG